MTKRLAVVCSALGLALAVGCERDNVDPEDRMETPGVDVTPDTRRDIDEPDLAPEPGEERLDEPDLAPEPGERLREPDVAPEPEDIDRGSPDLAPEPQEVDPGGPDLAPEPEEVD